MPTLSWELYWMQKKLLLRRNVYSKKDFTTLLNATVTDWGNLSGEEVITTDVNLGVEIDTEWQQGTAYDVEI